MKLAARFIKLMLFVAGFVIILLFIFPVAKEFLRSRRATTPEYSAGYYAAANSNTLIGKDFYFPVAKEFLRSRLATTPEYSAVHYAAANNNTLIGKYFYFDNETWILLQNILSDQTFARRPVMSMDANTPFFDLVVPVTGASSNHYQEFKENIGHFKELFPGTRVVFYDLGLSRSEVRDVLTTLPFVVYRMFDFNAYPVHVRNLTNYAWKPLLIQEMLAEFDGVMWFDSSVAFKGDHTYVIMQRLARYKSGFMFYVGPTRHSIIAATHPGMLEYLPMKTEEAVNDMFQASAMVIINTAEVQEHIMKWLVFCALENDCIAPVGSKLYCSLNLPREKFGDCHRYDQSLVNILVSNCYSSDSERYYFAEGNFAEMNRL